VSPQLEVQLIAAVAAVACALPGVFLLLRGTAMMSDAISHSILPGIVIGFFLTGNLSSPWLVAGAAMMGLVTVFLVETLQGTRLVRQDAAIGLVFPALFSIGVILISRYAGDVHLDIDAVLLGELAFAPFNRWIAGGVDLGPMALWTMSGVLLINLLFLIAFFKELKIATFDPLLAASQGFSPRALHYSLMALVSLTAVAAFDAVGSILVVALMVAPPAAALLLTDRLSVLLQLSALMALTSAVSGYWTARLLDASIAGSMSTLAGIIFGLAWLMAPERGLLALARRRRRQRREFARAMLAIHLYNHERLPEAEQESEIRHLGEHLRWKPTFTAAVLQETERTGLVQRAGTRLALTPKGRDLARRVLGASSQTLS
jgi:manganese/zinc/iron transport system permease protein